MIPQDAETIVAIAALAAQADGEQDAAERARISEMAAGLGVPDDLTGVASALASSVGLSAALARLAEQLSDDEARRVAYDTAVSVCYADGWVNPSEAAFLRTLATSLRIDPAGVDARAAGVHDAVNAATTSGMAGTQSASAQAAGAPNTGAANAGAANAGAETSGGARTSSPSSEALDAFILDQAMMSAALELLPDRLANLGILPLQLRMVQQIGERNGQQMNASQVKDLVAVFGIGAAAQVMEKMVRNTLGGFAGMLGRGVLGSMLGGMAGGAAGFAAGASVTFATTYALGHAAEQYYAQGRSISTADMKALFERFKTDATTMYPRVESRIRELAGSGNIGSVLRSAPR